MNRSLSKAKDAVIDAAKKFTSVTVARGQTSFPKAPKDFERIGIRFDYDGEIESNGIVYNRFQVQPNAGKIPSGVRDWREKNGGTHAVMGTMLVKKGGSKEDVVEGFEKFEEDFKSSD